MTDKYLVKPIAFYLPQFHPTLENDLWWGKGFTEWTNVTKARPLFDGHYQPHLPADLGFYDLRLPESRIAQAELAREYGIYGFCYYHYWFNGERLLHRPFDEVLCGEPDFPFCLCWANENWTRRWDGCDREILRQQRYGPEDDVEHIRWLANAFSDRRYIRVNGKPLFLVYAAAHLPDPRGTTDTWREEALRLGIGELFLASVESIRSILPDPRSYGFDAAVDFQPRWRDAPPTIIRRRRYHYWAKRLGLLHFYDFQLWDYGQFVERMINSPEPDYLRFSCVNPSWDNSARRKDDAYVLSGSTPEVYEAWLKSSVKRTVSIPELEGYVFLNAWNEWAEGNHLEPCQKWGRSYLEATLNAIQPQRQK